MRAASAIICSCQPMISRRRISTIWLKSIPLMPHSTVRASTSGTRNAKARSNSRYPSPSWPANRSVTTDPIKLTLAAMRTP